MLYDTDQFETFHEGDIDCSEGDPENRQLANKDQGPEKHRENNGSRNRNNITRKVALCAIVFGTLVGCGILVQSLAQRKEALGPTSASPSMVPSAAPSISHSAAPTTSARPSQAPSSTPSSSPTNAPTVEHVVVPVNPVPDRRPRSYFNYDPNDQRFGPRNWKRINMNGTYFEEFGSNGFGIWKGHLQDHVADSTLNRCGVSGKQSPIDLHHTSGTESECTATHQIRTHRSVYRLSSKEIKKTIEPSKLRLIFPRRQCLDLSSRECNSRRPPMADFPNWSSTTTHYSDLLNLDIKIPGEHTVEGETFDVEIQMLHLHLDASRMGYIGIPVRAMHGRYNKEYQAMLDQFQLVYDSDKAACEGRRLRQPAQRESWDSHTDTVNGSDAPRHLQSEAAFDPYRDFLKTVYFYRYHGSNTEPPCFPITWFVMTTPLVIDFQQLRQTKMLLFTHVDGNCRKTSVHNSDQQVVRPLQPLGVVPSTKKKREVMLCTEDDFDPDN